MGAHCLQMLGASHAGTLFEMITGRGAEVMKLKGYGISTGTSADCVILQAENMMESLRLRPNRLAVFRKGKMIASSPEVFSTVRLGSKEMSVSFNSAG